MANKIKIRRDTAANWTFVNPILAQAEPAYETDTKRIKFGDGTTPWRDLPYYDDVLSNNYITQAEFDAAIATVVGLSPETLDTLEELAGAINNDPQFFDNIQNDVDLKPDRSELKEVAFSGRYQDLEGTPNLVTETFVTNAIAVETAARTAAITSATSTLDANITAEISAREQAIEDEADLRTIADNDLQTAINAEVTRATGIEQGLRTDLTAETSARTVADTTLQGNIDAAVEDLTDAINLESSTREAADTTLQNNIDAETSAREAADNTLQSNIDVEAAAREAADNTLQSNIDAETSAREAADTTLQNNIDLVSGDLTAAISSAIGTLNSNINDEATTRAAADQDLQNQINNLAENIDPAALDSLTEIVAAFNAGDSSLVSTVNNLQITLQGNIDAEVTARTNADNALQDNIDAEVTARTNADTALQGNIDAETTAREAADTALQSNIDGEAIARSTADDILQNNIDAETTARIAADELLDASITNLSTTKLNVSDFNTTADTWLGTKTMFTVTDSPVDDTDAANKAYVDSQVSGLSTSSIANGTSLASLPTADGDFVVSLNGGDKQWTFNAVSGDLTLPGGGNINGSDYDIDIIAGDNGDNIYGTVSLVTNSFVGPGTNSLTFNSLGEITVSTVGANDGLVKWVGNSSGDGNGYTTMVLVPDTTVEGNDQYLIIDPTAPSHIHIRAGGTQDQSNADLFLGGEKTHVLVSDSNGSVRISQQEESQTFSATINAGLDYSTAEWTSDGVNHQITFNDVQQTTLNAIWGQNGSTNNIEIYDGSNYVTVQTSGSFTPGLGQSAVVYVNQAPATSPTSVVTAYFNSIDMVSTFVEVNNRDVRIEAQDDLRMFSRDVFLLANYSTTDSIRIATNYNNNEKSWDFGIDGVLQVPGAVNFLQNNTIPLGAPEFGGATDRIRLWDFAGGGSGFNYAIGAEGNHVWFAMDVNDGTGGFKFYSRDNQVFKIRDDGALMFADATTQTTAYPGTSILDGYATESYVDTADQNLQTQIDNIVANIDPAQLDSLTEIVAAFNAGDSSLVSTVNNLQITLQNNIDAKANSADVYLKVETYNQTEIDNALSLKADVLATNTALGTKANSADVYTKTESDAALALKANSADVDTALALKANAADVYTQTQVDNALALKANSADVYTQTQVDTALALKADTASLAAVATSGDYDDLTDRIEYSTLGALAERTVQIGAGTLSYTPTIETGIIAAGNHEGTYAGLTVQNNNSNATSSANIYFSNTGSTETSDFAVIGLNGPNYNFGFDSVDGAKKLLYIANTDGDITLIPNYYNGGNIHLGYASGAAAISVTNNGGLSLGTTWNNTAQTYVLNQGTAGQVLTSGGNAGAVTWTTLPTALSAFTNDTNFITSAQIESFETDPVFESWKAATYDTSAAASITTQQVTNWDSAVAWGDHSVEGYLTSATLAAAETDPTVPQHVKDIQETDISNWNTAYGWGNHATAGYLTSATLGETDPIFTAWKDTTYDMSAAAGITAQQISDWNAVTTYGDHRTAGYLTTTAFNATVAGSITSQKVTNWDAAYSWGNHADAGYLSTNAAETMLESYATQTFVNNKVAEVIGAAPEALNTLYEIAAAINDDSAFASTVMSQIGLKLDASSPAGSILTTDITNWNTAYGWGNHADGNYLTAESDPIFLASAAADITGADITTWNSVTQKANSADVYTKVETDAALALKADSASLAAVATSGSYDDLTNKPTLFDGAYSNLTGAPTLATVATSGDYNDLTNKPTVLSTAVQCLAGQTTTVYTASSSDVSTIKLVIQVEQFTGTTEIQSSEVIVVRAIGTSTVMSAVYGTVYSGAAALATFAATVNGSGLVEVTCQPVGASTIYAKAVATEIKTED